MRKDFGEHLANLKEEQNEESSAIKYQEMCTIPEEVRVPWTCGSSRRNWDWPGHKVIQDWPKPKNKQEVRSCLTLCIGDLLIYSAKLLRSLNSLSEKNKLFCWTPGCQQAFSSLKKCLTTTTVLAYPKDRGLFITDESSSHKSILEVLSQIQEDQVVVIKYFSKNFAKAESNYCVVRKEQFVFVW